VLFQLLSNATRFTLKGTITINVTGIEDDENKNEMDYF
jgi:signal transduction histidine kinase